MAIIINADTAVCPQCGYEQTKFYKKEKEGELYFMCHRCGCAYSEKPLRNKDGSPKLTKEGKLKIRRSQRKGFGAVGLCQQFFGYSYMRLSRPPTEQKIDEIKIAIECEGCGYLTVWDEEKKVAQLITTRCKEICEG